MFGPEMKLVISLTGPRGSGKSLVLSALKSFMEHSSEFRADFYASNFSFGQIVSGTEHLEASVKMRVSEEP